MVQPPQLDQIDRGTLGGWSQETYLRRMRRRDQEDLINSGRAGRGTCWWIFVIALVATAGATSLVLPPAAQAAPTTYISTTNVSCTAGQTVDTCGKTGLGAGPRSASGNRNCGLNTGSLPTGIYFNAARNMFDGTFTAAGSWTFTETWSMACGYADATQYVYNFTIGTPTVTPVVSSSLTLFATVGQAITPYFITGANSPTSFDASVLPSGLNVNTSSGQISGTPANAGTFSVTISASNSAGTGSATLVFTISPGTQAPVGLSSTSATFGAALGLASSGGSGTGAVAFTIASAGTANCSMPTLTTLSAASAGDCAVTVTKESDVNYNAASAIVSVHFASANQDVLLLDSVYGTFGTTLLLVGSGGSGSGAVSFAVTDPGSAGCSLATTSSLTSTGAGTCLVRVDKAADGNFNSASSVATTVTLTATTQASAVTMTSSTSKTFGSALSLSASGGSGTGSMIFSVVDSGTAGCTISGTQLSSTGDLGTTCTIKAMRSADANYFARESSIQTITVDTRAVQPTLTVASPMVTFGTPVTLTSTGGAGTGAISYFVSTPGTAGCSMNFDVLHTTGDVGTTCGIAAYKAASTNYLQSSSAEVMVTITGQGTQAITFVAPSDREFSSTAFALAPSSNSNLAVTLSSASPTTCSAAGTSIMMILPGTCVIDAHQSGNTNYLAATTIRRSFEISPATQTVSWSPVSGAFTTASPFTMSAAVGSAGGTVSYSVLTTGLAHCVIADSTIPSVSFDSAGFCTIEAAAASTSTHQSAEMTIVLAISLPPAAQSTGGSSSAPEVTLMVVKVRSLDPIIENGGLAPGAHIVTVDGLHASVRVEANSTSTGLDVIGQGWLIKLVARGSDGSPQPLKPGGVLAVTGGSLIDISGSGFDALSQIRIYLLSRTSHLGSLMTDSSGDFTGSIVVPRESLIGPNTLQINGFTMDRVVRSLSLGIRVFSTEPARAVTVGSRVYFDYKSASLTAKAKRSLLSMIAQLPKNQPFMTGVTGALRARGSTAFEKSLAKERAKAVATFLASHGLPGKVAWSVRQVEVRDRYRDRRVEISVSPNI